VQPCNCQFDRGELVEECDSHEIIRAIAEFHNF
jgi:hypothetical protein